MTGNRGEVQVTEGWKHMDACDYASAFSCFNKATELQPDNGFAWYSRALAEESLAPPGNDKDRLRDVVKAYDEVIALDPDIAAAWYRRGLAKLDLRELEESCSDFSRAIELEPDVSEFWFERGEARKLLERYETALGDFEQAVSLDPKRAAAWAERGGMKVTLDRWKEGVKDLDRAIRLDPEIAEAWFYRGIANMKLNRHRDAIQDMNKALALQLGSDSAAFAWNVIGHCRMFFEEFEESVKAFSKGISIVPEFAELWFSRAMARSSQGGHREAIKDMDRAVELEPDNAQYLAIRGEMKRRAGHSEESGSESGDAESGRFEEAIKDLDRAVELEPDNAEFLCNRGLAKCHIVSFKDGFRDLDRAVELEPDNARFRVRRGAMKWRLEQIVGVLDVPMEYREAGSGRLEEALRDYDMALKLKPGNVGFRRQRRELKKFIFRRRHPRRPGRGA